MGNGELRVQRHVDLGRAQSERFVCSLGSTHLTEHHSYIVMGKQEEVKSTRLGWPKERKVEALKEEKINC